MTRRVGLIGDPVAHSISPAIQNAALETAGIDARYALWPTVLADLPKRVAGLRDPDVLGANVTVPHKRAVMAYLDDVSERAVRAGAVNTVVNRDGRLSGDNTDIIGFVTSLREVCANPESRPAVILGAGGAARAVVLALAELGAPRIVVANRSPERADALAADLDSVVIERIPMDGDALADVLPDVEILINATSLGWHPGELPVDPALLDLLSPSALVVDLTYRDTDLLAAARARNLQTLDGLPMLVYQGAEAFTRWTGVDAPVAIMLSAAAAARDART